MVTHNLYMTCMMPAGQEHLLPATSCKYGHTYICKDFADAGDRALAARRAYDMAAIVLHGIGKARTNFAKERYVNEPLMQVHDSCAP